MESEDQRRMLSIQRCNRFLRAHDFPGSAIRKSAKRLAVIGSELEALEQRERHARHLVPWDGKEIRKRCRDLRKEILTPIARAAKAVGGFIEHTPGAAVALKVPHLSHSAEKHIAAAGRFVEFMKDHRRAFLRETGFDRNILTKLKAATEELRFQTTFRHTTRKERSALLRDIKSRLTKGRREIELLGSLLEPFLIGQKLELDWAAASRVGPKKGRPRDTPEERQKKKDDKAQKKAANQDEQRKRREDAKAARRALKEQKAQAKKDALQRKKHPKSPQPPAAPPPVEQPLTKPEFLQRLAEEGGEIER